MKTQMAEQSPPSIPPDDVRQVLENLLNSKHFVNAHKKKEFLRLICDFYIEGRAQDLNEYIIGYDVFSRDSNYNPSDDPIVRVFAHEIRKKLEAYYANEGADDPIRLEIPAGGYQPVFTAHLPEHEAESSETGDSLQAQHEAGSIQRRSLIGKIAVGFVISGLVIAVIVLVISNRHLQQAVAEIEIAKNPERYGEVWTSFLKDKNPPLVILSNPPVLRFTNPSDPEALTKGSIPLTPEAVEFLKEEFVTNPEVSIKEAKGPAGNDAGLAGGRIVSEQTPRLIVRKNTHTGMGEAIGLHYLTDFFRKASRSILLKQSRTLSAEDLKMHNVIMLGGVWVNEWSAKLTRKEDFVFTDKATIENRNPQPGEEREYIPQFDGRTGDLKVDYALITLKPNISDANKVMLLAGVYSQGTEAAAEYITNKSYLDHLSQRLTQSEKAPRYFQALLKVEVENGIPTTISLLALHELTPAEP